MDTKGEGESHPKLAVSVAVSIVKSRQVSEVKNTKFSKATSVSGGKKGVLKVKVEKMWLRGGFSQCTDASILKGNISLDHRSVSPGVSGNQHGEVQAGVSSKKKEI